MSTSAIRRAPKVLLHDHLDGGLRPSDIDACAGSVKHLKRIVAQLRGRGPG